MEKLLENAKKIASSKSFQICAGVVLGVTVGTAAGYKYADVKLNDRYEQAVREEIADVKAFYAAKAAIEKPDLAVMARKYEAPDVSEDDTMESFEEKVMDAAKALVSYQGGSDEEAHEADAIEDQKTNHNIFVDGKPLNADDFDIDAPENRNMDFPYIISDTVFFENENNWTQSNLTYYEGDGVLCDERDVPVDRINNVVGDENLLRFGYLKHDKNTIYVRNEKLEGEYEIILSKGKYSWEVLGQQQSENHLQHGGHRIPRMRQDD